MRRAALLTISFILFFGTFAFAGELSPKDADGTNDDGAAGQYFLRGLSDRPFVFFDPRLESQGGVGTALSTGVSSLFYNPANLAESKGFKLNVPSLSVNVYSLSKLMKDQRVKTVVDNLLHGRETSNTQWAEFGLALVSKLNYGVNPFLGAQADVGFTVAGVGLGVIANVGAYAHNMTGQTADTRLAFKGDLGVVAGYGRKFEVGKAMSLSVGLSVGVFTGVDSYGYGPSDFNEMANSDNILEYILGKPAGASYRVPLNLGATFSMLDSLKFSLALRNVNFASVKVRQYGSLGDFLKNPFVAFKGASGAVSQTEYTSLGAGFLSSYLDIGVGYNPKWKLFNPRVEIDFVNLLNFSKNEYYDNTNIFSHLRIGVELHLLEFLLLDAGLNQGRFCFGARLDLWPIVIGVDYGWVDVTPTLGEAMSDRLSVTVKLGWDRSK